MSTRPGTGVRLEVRDINEVTKLASDSEEIVVVILGGTCSVAFDDGSTWDALGERADVFDGRATAFYVPVTRTCTVTPETELRVAVISSTTDVVHEPYVRRPADIQVEERGQGAWMREVHNIVGANESSERLFVGETFNGKGVWSSYPPHKHDKHNPPHEYALDEVFLVRVSPPSGFGVFVHYPSDDGPRYADVVNDGEIVEVQSGYHSFVVAAECRFYYLWALAGECRKSAFFTDPRDAWILEGIQ